MNDRNELFRTVLEFSNVAKLRYSGNSYADPVISAVLCKIGGLAMLAIDGTDREVRLALKKLKQIDIRNLVSPGE